MYQITFQFENGGKPVIVDAAPNTSLLDVAKAANVAIDAPCNGNGSCGKCRVKILEGTVDSTPTHHISEEDYAAGWRLSCASKPASDVVVQVPDIASAYQSRMKTADLSTGEEVATFNKLQEDIREAGVDISCDFVSGVRDRGPGCPAASGSPEDPRLSGSGSAGTPRSGSERAGVWPDRTVCRFGEPGWKNV